MTHLPRRGDDAGVLAIARAMRTTRRGRLIDCALDTVLVAATDAVAVALPGSAAPAPAQLPGSVRHPR